MGVELVKVKIHWINPYTEVICLSTTEIARLSLMAKVTFFNKKKNFGTARIFSVIKGKNFRKYIGLEVAFSVITIIFCLKK